MTIFGGSDLAAPTGAATSGASSGLLKPATESTKAAFADGEIEVLRRSNAVVARSGADHPPAGQKLAEAALAHIQPALDQMCVRNSNRLALRSPDDEYLT